MRLYGYDRYCIVLNTSATAVWHCTYGSYSRAYCPPVWYISSKLGGRPIAYYCTLTEDVVDVHCRVHDHILFARAMEEEKVD